MDKYNIITGLNRNYVEHLLVMMESLFFNNKNIIIDFYVMHEDLENEDILKINEIEKKYSNCDIIFLKIEKEKFKNFKLHQYFKISTYFRLFIPQVVPEYLSTILYLDVDIIINGPIKNILDIDLKEYYLAAVEDKSTIGYNKRLDIPENFSYFNAGVLLINLVKLRETKIFNDIIEYIKKYPDKLLWLDQDALNIFCYNNWMQLDTKWNYHKYFTILRKNNLNIISKFDSPIIIHYTGPVKPWNINDDNPLNYLYFKYRKNILDEPIQENKKIIKNIFFKKIYFKLKTNSNAIKLLKLLCHSKFLRLMFHKLKRSELPHEKIISNYLFQEIDISYFKIYSYIDYQFNEISYYENYIHFSGFLFKRNINSILCKSYMILINLKNNKETIFLLNKNENDFINKIYNDEKIDYAQSFFYGYIDRKCIESGKYSLNLLIIDHNSELLFYNSTNIKIIN